MAIKNVLAFIAVRDIDAGIRWYKMLLAESYTQPIKGLAEWQFEAGGWLQVSEQAAGGGTFGDSHLTLRNWKEVWRAWLTLGDQQGEPANISLNSTYNRTIHSRRSRTDSRPRQRSHHSPSSHTDNPMRRQRRCQPQLASPILPNPRGPNPDGSRPTYRPNRGGLRHPTQGGLRSDPQLPNPVSLRLPSRAVLQCRRS
jgi:hypothetical protein